MKLIYICLFLLLSLLPLQAGEPQKIQLPEHPSRIMTYSGKELQKYIWQRCRLLLPVEERKADKQEKSIICLQVDSISLGKEEYSIHRQQENLYIRGGSAVAVLYGVYTYAEHLGVRFALHGDILPDEKFNESLYDCPEIKGKPLFEKRGLLPFHDFPEGPDLWDADMYKSCITQMTKMKLNFFSLHTYPHVEPNVWIGLAEDVLPNGNVSYSYPTSLANTARSTSWGYSAMDTRDYSSGAASLFGDSAFMSPVLNGVPWPKDSVQMKNVAHLKRAVEYYLYDPDFRKKFDNDADGTLKNYAIEASAKDVEILVNARAAKEISSNPEKIPLAVWQYYSFFAEKLQWRDNSQLVRCVPENKAFKKWRQRQVNRSWGEFNGENSSFIHVPLVFELSLGCSVGCPFCALSSEQLQKIFRATEDNIELWKAILEISKEIIGPAAGEGVCYFATEPLDNPDYEVFSGLFLKILGRTPQITTAVAMRNPERTRNLILDSLNGPPIIHRFSILNLQTFRDICNLAVIIIEATLSLLIEMVENILSNLSNTTRIHHCSLTIDSWNISIGNTFLRMHHLEIIDTEW